jgi:predicted kinase
MSGLSGTGKSTVAHRLARALDIPLFTSDVVRKELAGVAGAAPAAWGQGAYTPQWTRATYDRLFALAEESLAAGQPAILDATFLTSDQRSAAATLAANRGVPCVLIETIADEAIVTARLAARVGSTSDATLATYRRQAAAVAANPPVIPNGALALAVDTDGDVTRAFDALVAALAVAGIVTAVVPESA